jgi:hypothetical protein
MSDKVNAWLALLPPEDVHPGGRVKASILASKSAFGVAA